MSRTASAIAAITGASTISASSAKHRSSACLIANCHPRGLVGRNEIEGQAAEVIEDRAVVDRLEQPRHERDLDPELLALPDLLDEHVVGLGGEGQDHAARTRLPDRLGQVVRPAQDRDGGSGA